MLLKVSQAIKRNASQQFRATNRNSIFLERPNNQVACHSFRTASNDHVERCIKEMIGSLEVVNLTSMLGLPSWNDESRGMSHRNVKVAVALTCKRLVRPGAT